MDSISGKLGNKSITLKTLVQQNKVNKKVHTGMIFKMHTWKVFTVLWFETIFNDIRF